MPGAYTWSILATPWTWTLSVILTPLDIQMSGKTKLANHLGIGN
jgi:hypothetical protein